MMKFSAFFFFLSTVTIHGSYASYSEDIAKNKLLPMSAAAYSNSSVNACLNNTFKNAQLINKYKTGFLDPHTAISVISNDDRAIIIAFGGSSIFTDLVLVDSQPYFGNKTQFIGGGNVSSYIYSSWKKLWDAGIQDDLLSAKNSNPSYKLWLTGHNIGGSFASITAAYVLKLGFYTSSQVLLYTFGQPRTGDNAFAIAHDQLLGASSYRITHRQDPIPHVPQKTDDGYYHHENEIFYNNNMTTGEGYAECDADESSSCSDGNLFDLSIDDHRHYFNVEVAKFGSAGCKN